MIDIEDSLDLVYVRFMSKRPQINIRADAELLRMIGELQRLDRSGPTAPTITDVIRRAVAETLDRWRHAAEKAGKRK